MKGNRVSPPQETSLTPGIQLRKSVAAYRIFHKRCDSGAPFNQLLTFADHIRLDVRSMNSSVKIDRRSVASWALYDFANSSFTTLVVTFIYATYFTKAIAADPVSGTAQWSLAVTITSLVVALASPYLGAIADRGGYRKRFLLISTIVVIVGSFAMFFPGPGQVL